MKKQKNPTNNLTHFQASAGSKQVSWNSEREILQTYLGYNISSWSKCDFQHRNRILRWRLSKLQRIVRSLDSGQSRLCQSHRSTCARVKSCLLTLSAIPSAAKLKAEAAELSSLYAWSGQSLAFVSASSLHSFISVIRTVLMKTRTEDPSCPLKKLDTWYCCTHEAREPKSTSDLHNNKDSKQIKAFIVRLWAWPWKTTVLANVLTAQTTY